MKRNILFLLLAFALGLSLLSGCGGESSQTTPIPEPTPSPTLAPAAPAEEQDTPAPAPEGNAGQEILEAMPYCGDAAACTMTAEQALAYAQLLADGIAGKAPQPEGHYDWTDSPVVYWDTPYTVVGYGGPYETDRANVILGDFSGDGTAYLCVLSTLNSECGFDVYYSDGGPASFVWGDEVNAGRAYTEFGLDETGRMLISNGGSGGVGYHSSDLYGVADGEIVVLHSYISDFDYSSNEMHETIDGVETVYSLEEWEAKDTTLDWEEVPSAAYTPIPLRDMIDYLNQYAAAKGSTQSVAVEERSGLSEMAAAMLEVLNSELPDQAMSDARLVDLDGDGVKELMLYDGMQSYLYYWQDGRLQSKNVGALVGGSVEWWLCEDTATGERGIEHCVIGGGDFIGSSSVIYYPSREASFSDRRGLEDGAETRYTVNGEQASQEQHEAVRAQNRRVEELVSEMGGRVYVEETLAELRAML